MLHNLEGCLVTWIVRASVVLALLASVVGCVEIPTNTGSSFSIDRSTCYGSCPAYRFTLYADDSYMWQGRAHVRVTGTMRGHMDTGTFAAAKELLHSARYLEFNDSYEGGSACEIWQTDNQTVKIEVVDATTSKSITHYLGCKGFARQEELTRLEERMDEIFRTRKFAH